MATDLDTARRHFPRLDGHHSLGEFRKLFADFTVVGRLAVGEWVDISRNGMIKGVSEFKEFLFSKSASLGLLGWTPVARAALWAAAKADAKAKAKSASTVRRRNAYLSNFSSVLGRAPRRRSSTSNDAEEAFGPSPAPATPGVAPAAAYPGLEEALEEVIDADATVLQADLSGDDVADEDNWMECARCSECRVVPRGLFLTFQKKEASFFCRFVGAACCLIKNPSAFDFFLWKWVKIPWVLQCLGLMGRCNGGRFRQQKTQSSCSPPALTCLLLTCLFYCVRTCAPLDVRPLNFIDSCPDISFSLSVFLDFSFPRLIPRRCVLWYLPRFH